jgi:L-ascorbate metabolism protein UlaG (beta-lactamase superfamily)
MKLKYFSHSAFQLTTNDDKVILLDPYLDDNPTSPVKSDDVHADYIILSHAHGDHLGDTVKIGHRCNSTVICVNELADYLIKKGCTAHNMHIGGGFNFDFGRVKLTIAHHGSKTPDDQYAGEPAGIIISTGGKNIYYTGDTGLFYDMKLIGKLNKIDYMLLPIGDNYTMGITDAVRAVEFVDPGVSIPMHYNTFPVIQADPNEFKKKLEAINRKCKVMEYGEEIEL